jgi:aminotransferase EvaB
MTAVRQVASRRGIGVLEDCAQSHGATHGERMAGSMSQVAAFSFYPTKILGGYGDGGMIVTDDPALAQRVQSLRMYGTKRTYYAEEHGYNSRLDEVHAEILLRKLARLESYVARRRALAQRYDRLLAGTGLALPRESPGNRHAYYLYVCRHPARDRIIERLAAREIIVNISYPWPIHLMRGYASLGYKPGSLPLTEQAAQEIFSLPMYPSLTEAEQDAVCKALGEILESEL